MSERAEAYTIVVGKADGSSQQQHQHEARRNPRQHASSQKQSSRSVPQLPQLDRIPRDAKWLILENDVPTDEEWDILGSYFTSVENLEVEAGHNEFLNDGLMPANWPLKRLLISSSSGEVTQNPHILLGKVQHLIFFFTMGIRLEGPTSDEFFGAHDEAVASGGTVPHHVGANGLKITFLPRLVREWMEAKYNGVQVDIASDTPENNADVHLDSDPLVPADVSNPPALSKFEILENDAIEVFIRFVLARPYLAFNLRTLNIRSTNCCDLADSPEDAFGGFLSEMKQLDTLVLTLGEVFDDEITLAMLYQSLPDNIRTLRFRGPVSLTRHAQWAEWVSNFGKAEFLPNLERLSFVCDICHGDLAQNGGPKPRRSANGEEIKWARERCEQLLEAVRGRESQSGGREVTIEPFVEQWASKSSMLDNVDAAWYSG